MAAAGSRDRGRLAVLGARLLPTSALPTEVGVFGVLGMFLVGSWLYVVLSSLLFYRLAFVRLVGEDVGAAYWVSIGAGAITVRGGHARRGNGARAGAGRPAALR